MLIFAQNCLKTVKGMFLFYVIFILVVFIGVPGLVWLVFWGLGKLLGIFIPLAAPIGKWTGTILSLGLIVCFVFGLTLGWRIVRIRHIELTFKDLPASFDGYKVAHLSDWHLGTYSKNHRTIEREVRKLLEEKPDLVVFTGDAVNYDPAELEPFMGILSKLEAPDGVWSVMGNHDYCEYFPGNTPELQAAHIARLQEIEKEMGWNMLLNSNTVISNGRDSIALVGVENDGQPPFPQYADLGKALSGLPEGIFKIILSHDPTHWRRAILPETDIQLMLAGHTHAWQFRIGKLSPAMLAFKEWGGLYEEGGRKLFVSTGAGGNIPFRFGAWPEVDILVLRGEE